MLYDLLSGCAASIFVHGSSFLTKVLYMACVARLYDTIRFCFICF